MESIGFSHPTVLTLNFPSLTLLALDSRICKLSGRVTSDRYDKLIQLRPCVFLACFADCSLIDQIRDALLSDPPQNPRFIGDLALFVQNTINKALANANGGVVVDNNNNNNRSGEFVLIGRCDLDSRCYVFNISKGANTWMFFAKREVGSVATAASRLIRAVNTFIEENVVDEKMTEEEAIDYGLRCMRNVTMSSWFSGGKIQIVVVKPGFSNVHGWEQDDTSSCNNPYFYQGKRVSEGY